MLYQHVESLCMSICSSYLQVGRTLPLIYYKVYDCFVYCRLYGMLHNMPYQHKNNLQILTKHLGHRQGSNPESFE